MSRLRTVVPRPDPLGAMLALGELWTFSASASQQYREVWSRPGDHGAGLR